MTNLFYHMLDQRTPTFSHDCTSKEALASKQNLLQLQDEFTSVHMDVFVVQEL